MGLLDQFTGDERGLLGLALMQAAQPRAGGPAGIGEGLLGAINMIQQRKAAQEDRDMRRQLMQSQIAETQAQAQQRQAQAQEQQRKALEAARIQSLLQSTFMPVTGTQANAVSGIAGPRPEALGVVGQQRPVNYQQLLAQGVPADLVKSLAESRNYGRDKVARTVKGIGPDGREYEYQLDEYGGKVGSPFQQYKAPIQADTGGAITWRDPYNPMQVIGSVGKTMTPDGQASNAVAWSRLAFDKQKDARDQAGAGQLVETDNGYVRVGKDNRVTPVFAPGGGMQPLRGKGSMTEDQGKATGWLVQAENAYKNMKASGFDSSGKPTSAAYPGLNDALSKVPGMAPVANWFRGADRQKFMQGSSSLSEALLRAATGAGINKDEAAQKVMEITPQFGDSDEVIQQKMDAIPLYIESLKVRAGQGAAKAATIGKPAGGQVKFLGFEN